MSARKTIIGGSLSNPHFRKALRHYRILDEVMSVRNKYDEIAKRLNIVPTRPNSTKLLKRGSDAYKRFIERETIRRYDIVLEQIAEAKETATKSQKTNLMTSIKRDKVKPRVVDKFIIDAYNKFKLYNYELKDVTTLKELYDIISKEMAKLGDMNFATIFFENNTTGKVRGLSIKVSNFDTYEDFESYVNKMINGEIVGSDPFPEDEFTLLFDNIHIATYSLPSAYGKADDIMFECQGISSEKRICGFECLNLLGGRINEKYAKEFRRVERVIQYIQENNCKINLVCNSFYIKKPQFQIVNANGKERLEIYNRKKKRNDLKVVSRLYDNDIELTYLVKLDDAEHTIIYDEIGEHFDIITTPAPILKQNVKISLEGEVIMNDKIIFTPKQIIINSQIKNSGGFEYLFFDYETVIDFKRSSCMRPYSLSILRLTDDELVILEKKDFDKDINAIANIRKRKCITFLGYDCNQQFIKWFCKEQQNTTFCFVGFNNSNFDNFILLDDLLRYDQNTNRVSYNVNNVFYNGSQLLNFYINGRHSVFDLHKHLCIGSLDKNCKSFKVNCCAKKSFDHSKAQLLHEDNNLINFITGNEELKEYNEYDVLATAVLFQKYRLALENIPSIKKYARDIKSTITIGSLIYKVFKDHTAKFTRTFGDDGKLKPTFGKLKYQHYKDLQKYKIAGRVELFNSIQKINERMASTDVCSLYPFVMAILNIYYPLGSIIEVDEYKGDDEIGFYYCDIDQSNLRPNNLPKIYALKTEIENNWGHETILENYLVSNVMIGLLRKYGCNVVVKNGFIFEKKMKSCEMFKFLLEMMKAKNEQDNFNKTKDDNYNPALRETLKLLMNSLSGKVIEGLHTEKTKDFDNEAEYFKIAEQAKSVNFINCIGNKLFATYELDEEAVCETDQRPIYLGVLIYDYAKRYMYENSYSKIGLNDLVYTDTDASKFRYNAMDRWVEWINNNNIQVPHWEEVETYDDRYCNHLIYNPHSKVFGSYEDELEEMIGDEYLFYCLEKKSWAYSVLKDNKWKDKFKFKGINGRALMLTLEEPFIEEHIIRSKGGLLRTEYKVKPESELEVYKWCEDNKDRQIERGNVLKFYEQIYATKEAYVMTNSFRKIVKNSAHSVDMGDDEKYNGLMNKIQVNYMMKRIKINQS